MPDQAKIIRWENPPPPRRVVRGNGRPIRASWRNPRKSGGSRWDAVAAELRSRPGEFAVIHEGRSYSGLAAKINLGRLWCFQPAGHFEGTTRRIADGIAVYARYLGDGQAGR